MRPFPALRHAMCASACLVGLAAGEALQPALSCFIPDQPAFTRLLAAHPCAAAWPAGPAGDPAWVAAAKQAAQVRGEFLILPPHAGRPVCEATVALLSAAGEGAPASSALRTQRAGAWWLMGLSPRPLVLPESPRLGAGRRGGDLTLSGHLPSWSRLLERDRSEAMVRLLAAWGLGQAEVVVDLQEGRFADQARLPGAHLPLRAVDQGALAGVPAGELAIAAIAVDGPALAKHVRLVLAAAGADPAVIEASMQEVCGIGLEQAAEALDGTIGLSLHGTLAQLGFLCSLPRNPVLEGVLLRWLEQGQPEQGATLLGAAGEQPVPLWWPGSGPLLVRLGEGRMWFSNAPELLNACAADPPPALIPRWAEAEGAVGLLRWGRGVLGSAVSVAPSGPLAAALGVCLAGGAAPAGSLVVHQDAQGLRSVGVQALAWAAPLLSLAPSWAPALAQDYVRECRRVSEDNLGTILRRALAFSKETSGHWPRDVEDLRAWAKDLTDEQFAAVGRPDLLQPVCYVPPLVDPPADQPVLVQDPAAHDGLGSLVGFANGRVEYKEGVLYWQEAKRLSALAKARNLSVDGSEWATAVKVF